MMYNDSYNENKSDIAILQDRMEFKGKVISRNKEDHFIFRKRTVFKMIQL